MSTQYNCGEDSYAGGYMLMRYFARQSASLGVTEGDLSLRAGYGDTGTIDNSGGVWASSNDLVSEYQASYFNQNLI